MYMACLAWKIYNYHKLLLDFGKHPCCGFGYLVRSKYLLFFILKSIFIYILLIGSLVKHKNMERQSDQQG